MILAIVSVVLNQLRSEEVKVVVCLAQEVEKLEKKFQAIQARLAAAEQRELKDAEIRHWLDELKYASYDMEDVLDQWITAILKRQIGEVDENAHIPHMMKVCSFFSAASCFGFEPVFLCLDIAFKVISINQKLDDISRQKKMITLCDTRSTREDEEIPTTSSIDESEVHGRDNEKNTLKRKLISKSSEQQNAVQIISLVGMGGIGKTTLARLVYNDEEVIDNFEKMIWVCVSEPFDHTRIARAILEALKVKHKNLQELQSLMQRIQKSITGRKFLLVLDDVWTDNDRKWKPFHRCLISGGKGSKILVTTRKESVAKMMKSIDIVAVEKLSKQDCWSLFEHFFAKSPSDYEHLKEIVPKIIDKCKGLPLAVEVIGRLLSSKENIQELENIPEWTNILESELWQLEEFEQNLSPSLLLSYYDLPSKIKQCFLYCVVFPKNYDIKKDELIQLWMAQGYITPKKNKDFEMIGEEYVNFLNSRSFFQQIKKDDMNTIISCKLHDVVHDLAQFLTKNECFVLDSSYSENSWSDSLKQKLRHLVVLSNKDLISKFKAKKLRSLLIDSIDVSMDVTGLKDIFDKLTCLRTLKITKLCNSICEIPEGIEKLRHLRCLKLVGLDIEKLPETSCELVNLQTLDLRECYKLKTLPQGIGKLVNLRHLIFDTHQLEYMPKGIERLKCLRTLSKFVGKSSGIDGSKACKLEGLRHLNHLRGSISIELFGNVRDVDEAKNVDLGKKENLVDLELSFLMDLENEANYEAICEALQPPKNIKSLTIKRYGGKTRWPSWREPLHMLEKLSLEFDECKIMPTLGKLPSLEILKISDSQGLEREVNDFLGIEGGVQGASSSVTTFPKLKQLTLSYLCELEEWDLEKKILQSCRNSFT